LEGIGYTSGFYKFDPQDIPTMNDVLHDGTKNRVHCMLVQAFPGLGQPEGFAFGMVRNRICYCCLFVCVLSIKTIFIMITG
jgi:hypothetical protein